MIVRANKGACTQVSIERRTDGGKEMEHRKFVTPILALLIPFITGIPQPQFSLATEEIKLLKISPGDKRAIVKTSSGALEVIKVGDSLGEMSRVVEIVEGRIVIETQGERGSEQVIIRLENGSQRIERIHKVGDESPLLSIPQPIDETNRYFYDSYRGKLPFHINHCCPHASEPRMIAKIDLTPKRSKQTFLKRWNHENKW